MYFLSGNVSHVIEDKKDINDTIIAYTPILFWIVIIAIITAIILLFKRRNMIRAKNRQSLQNIEGKLDKLIEVLEKNSN